MGIGFIRVTAPAPCTFGVLTSEACTDTTLLAGLAGTLAGAVYWPVALIVPTVAFPPATPLTDQVTAVFDVPVIAGRELQRRIAWANIGRLRADRHAGLRGGGCACRARDARAAAGQRCQRNEDEAKRPVQ